MSLPLNIQEMNNWDLYNLLHLVANKDVNSNWLTPEQFELELQAKNIRLMRNLLGLPERYQPGTMQAGASGSTTLEDDLMPFLVLKTENLVNQETNLTDWYYVNDFYTSLSVFPEIISQQELSGRIRSPIRVATEKYPWAIRTQKGLKVWPDTVTQITVSYYRKPATPTFNTTVDPGTGFLQYSASTELEWRDENKMDIVYMIMQDMGVNVEKQDLSQLAQKLVEGGK